VKHRSIVVTFVAAAALLAAVLADAVVEGLSNAAVFWRGQYTDGSSVDLLPVFLIAVLALGLTLYLWLRLEARGKRPSARSLILSTARVLCRRQILRVLPLIFLLQIVVLLVMETTEQVVVYGHTFGGTVWLGGPVAVSLLIHAVFSVVCAFSISSALGALAKAVLRVVSSILTRYIARTRTRPTTALRLEPPLCSLTLGVTRSAVQRRGPPLSALA
jgi:hypothetical protein